MGERDVSPTVVSKVGPIKCTKHHRRRETNNTLWIVLLIFLFRYMSSSLSGNGENHGQGCGGGGGNSAIEGMDAVRDYQPAADEDENLTEAERQMREEELSFYSNSEHDFGDDNIWGLLSGAGGNIYEW